MLDNIAVRIGGALCVLAATTLWGEYKACGLNSRCQQLQQFRQGLQLLLTEINYTATPLPDALKNTGARLKEKEISGLLTLAGKMMKERDDLDAGDIWLEAIDVAYSRTNLTKEDRRVLEQLGVSLGSAHREGQEKQIQLVCTQTEDALGEAIENRNRGEKMWRYLGIMAGVSLVIILI